MLTLILPSTIGLRRSQFRKQNSNNSTDCDPQPAEHRPTEDNRAWRHDGFQVDQRTPLGSDPRRVPQPMTAIQHGLLAHTSELAAVHQLTLSALQPSRTRA